MPQATVSLAPEIVKNAVAAGCPEVAGADRVLALKRLARPKADVAMDGKPAISRGALQVHINALEVDAERKGLAMARLIRQSDECRGKSAAPIPGV